jgi:hypothetical protein
MKIGLSRPILSSELPSGSAGSRPIVQTCTKVLSRIILLACLAMPGTSLIGQQAQFPAAVVVPVVLDNHGCAPLSVILPSGTSIVEIINRTGFDPITYHVRAAASGSGTAPATVLDFNLPGRLSRGYHILTLSAGSYNLTLDQGAKWQCSITVK